MKQAVALLALAVGASTALTGCVSASDAYAINGDFVFDYVPSVRAQNAEKYAQDLTVCRDEATDRHPRDLFIGPTTRNILTVAQRQTVDECLRTRGYAL